MIRKSFLERTGGRGGITSPLMEIHNAMNCRNQGVRASGRQGIKFTDAETWQGKNHLEVRSFKVLNPILIVKNLSCKLPAVHEVFAERSKKDLIIS